jgi:hypothetical protein
MQGREELEFLGLSIAADRVNVDMDRFRSGSWAKVQDQPRGYVCASLGHVGGGQDRDRRGTGCREQCCDEDDRSRR